MAEEGTARKRTVDLAEHGHEGHRTALVRLAGGDEFVKVLGKYLVLHREVGSYRFVRE